jgi:glyoxylase I family protein
VRRSVMRRCLKGLGGFPTSTDGFILGPSHGIVGRLDFFFAGSIQQLIAAACHHGSSPSDLRRGWGIAMQIKISGLTPLIQVFDMPTSVAFYRDVMGFELVMSSRPGDHFDWALLQADGASLMLNTAYEADERPAVPDSTRRAGHGDTTLFFGCPNLDEAYQYLRSKGVAVEKPVIRDYGMKQLTVIDPDGYGLCFQHPEKAA